jgi:hypothetical protein
MFKTDNPADFLERAKMHEQLASATDDVPARKMHQAMAAEYRRKAGELTERINIDAPEPINRILKMEVAMQ